MNNDDRTAMETIRGTFASVIADGLKPQSVRGATDEQIDRWSQEQGVSQVPAAVREVLRLIGTKHGRWLAGSSFGVSEVDGETKRYALATLSNEKTEIADADTMLVLVGHQAYSFHIIDGADLIHPDPPVWVISEGEEAKRVWPSVTKWFESASPRVRDIRERLEMMHEFGDWIDPAWAEDIDLEFLNRSDQ
ncbi:hypothetical protein [Nocardia wallacei]|uniref:hypothetical protein n=1 Tax=Nocardia wallacei TaxID=480035 RepID=UPI002454F5ED|nr:hypothetical protein [Nocardia wallacei]